MILLLNEMRNKILIKLTGVYKRRFCGAIHTQAKPQTLQPLKWPTMNVVLFARNYIDGKCECAMEWRNQFFAHYGIGLAQLRTIDHLAVFNYIVLFCRFFDCLFRCAHFRRSLVFSGHSKCRTKWLKTSISVWDNPLYVSTNWNNLRVESTLAKSAAFFVRARPDKKRFATTVQQAKLSQWIWHFCSSHD